MSQPAVSNSSLALHAERISKSFPGVKALDNVSITLRAGRLTALLGENGAGKSTLMNIIAGVFPASSGTIFIKGEQASFSTTREAQDAGIAMIYQELNLVSNLSVAENIFLGREPKTRWGAVDSKKLHSETQKLLDQLELDVSPSTPLSELRVGQQQLVEIAKALSLNAQVLIMDEPTSAISEQEVEVLFRIIEKLKNQGVAIAYITHKMEELNRIGDDAIIMRDGKLVHTADLKDLSRDDIVAMMAGEKKAFIQKPRTEQNSNPYILEVKNLSLRHSKTKNTDFLRDIDINIRRGEILGIFGLMGSGRTELLECIFGLHPTLSSSEITIEGKPTTINSPNQAIKLGLALAPEDRKKEGLCLGMSVSDNTTLASLNKITSLGLINPKRESAFVGKALEEFNVKTPSKNELIRNLSGGQPTKSYFGEMAGHGTQNITARRTHPWH